jgi:hypothetical protein
MPVTESAEKKVWRVVSVVSGLIVGAGTVLIVTGGYARQVDVNTVRIDKIEPKVETLMADRENYKWIREALRKNDGEHKEIIAILRDLEKRGKK